MEVISFDFGGTLAFEEKEDWKVYHEILRSLGIETNEEFLKIAYEKARINWNERRKRGEIWNEKQMKVFVEDILEFIGLSNNRIAEEVVNLWARTQKFKAYEDVHEALDIIKEKGYKLIIISNVSSERNLRTYLSQINLSNYFDCLIASGTVGFEKPNREIFLLASRRIGVSPGEILHVGDSYEADYLGAINAGLKAVLLDRENKYASENVVRIKNLLELIKIIAIYES